MNEDRDNAQRFLATAGFHWHQRFQLIPGVYTPGVNDVDWLLQQCVLPDVRGKRVLDIGTNNGGVCFEMERRGAARIVGVDVVSPETFGFINTRDYLGSRAEYVQASVYELPELLVEPFDIVFLLGVLYHLRHPLLALDSVRAVTTELVIVETAVSDREMPECASMPLARFYRRDELGGDTSNWFAPTVACLHDWCLSAGLAPSHTRSWPEPRAERGLVQCVPTPGEAEYQQLSGERPIRGVKVGTSTPTDHSKSA